MTSSSPPAGDATPVTVLGLGNVLMGDDGLGPYVAEALQDGWELHPEVRVLEGTPGWDLAPLLMGTRALIVIDVVRTDGRPGEVREYGRAHLLRSPPPTRVSPHDPGLKDTLLLLDLQGSAPEHVLVVGVVPDEVRAGTGLSRAVRGAVPEAVERVAAELARLGYPAHRRTGASPADVWWERARRSA